MKRAISAALLAFCISLTCALAQDTTADTLWYWGGSTTVTPGTPFTMQYYSEDKRPIRIRIYRLTLDEAVAFTRGSRAQMGDPVWDGSVKEVTQHTDREISVGPFPIGFYEIRATLGRAQQTVLGNVTTLGLLRMDEGGRGAAWAIDLRTFRRHEGPTVFRLSGKDGEQSRHADVNGLAEFSGSIPSNAVLVAKTADGSADIWNASWSNGQGQHEIDFIQTDRPVYRPGQTVNFRAIVRSGYEDAYEIPAGKHRVQVSDSSGTAIYDRTLTLSRFGTLAGTVDLPKSARLGMYSVNIDGGQTKWFSVQAYKKPEYVIDARPSAQAIVGGDPAAVTVQADYVFGRPAAGMHVHYSLRSGRYWYHYYDPLAWNAHERDDSTAHLPGGNGDAVTDAKGQLRVAIPTEHVGYPYQLAFHVEARDASGRTVQTDTSMMVYPARIKLDLAPSLWFVNKGDDVALAVKASDLAGKPAPGTRVHLSYTRELWNDRERKQITQDAGADDVTLGTDGYGTVHWRPQQAGSYDIVASASDERGNLSVTSRYVWVMGGDDYWMPPTEQPVLVPAHETLSAGERPRVLVRLPSPGRDVLLAVVSDRVRSLHVLHVTGYTASFGFDAPPHATQFTVQAYLPSENGIAQAQVQFHRTTSKRLHIVLKADKSRYEPEDRATVDAYVTDSSGKPVRTELSLGIVDDAIYAVQSEDGVDPVNGFYGNTTYVYGDADWFRPNYLHQQYVPPPSGSEQGVPQGVTLKTIAKVSSRAAGNLVKPGTTADMFGVNAPVIRKTFLDTAYWTPAVVTDARGHARISFTWPDNLTTWRTTALGVTAQTAIGRATLETLVTKDFLVRLEMPRFLRTGDSTIITGIAQGQKNARGVRLQLEPQAGDPLSQLLQLDDNESASAQWPLDAGRLIGPRLLTLSGTDGLRSDAMQLPLPIESAGSAEHIRDAGNVSQSDSVALSVPSGYDAGSLHITLTPSVTAQLLENVRMLDVYPYYCTEQTMSAALPAVFVDRMFKRTGSAMPSDVSPPKVIAHAIDRLSELQHADGSWGWWETDEAHPFMTAYAMYGLAEFKKDGYAVPAQMFERGLESLKAQLASADTDTLRFWGGAQAGSEWNTRAFMLFALADADPSAVDRGLLEQTRRHAGGLNSYALAVLGLAYHELGDDAAASRLRDMLDARAQSTNAYTYWTGPTWHYAWEDDPIETTAYALRLNAALDPHAPIVARTIAFLRSEQRGSWWYTTKDTAAAVYAISEAEQPLPGEFDPDEIVNVIAGDRTVKTLHIVKPVLDAADAQIDVPASLLRDGTIVRFVRTGRGALYWATDFTRYAPWTVHTVRDDARRSLFARLFPQVPPLRITRSYRLDHRGPWRVGDVVHVHVRVTAREDVQYVAIEDPFPAGVEYAPPQGEAGTSNWSGVQFFDDRAVFFADRLYRRWPLDLNYDLRVTTPGLYAAPPPDAYAMYGPPISATGYGEQVTVNP